MKLQDYHYEFYEQLENGVNKHELTILKSDLRRFLDSVRDFQAKANRLCSQVEIHDRELDVLTLNEWQLAAQACYFDVHSAVQYLCRWQDEIINFNLIKELCQSQKPQQQ